MAVGARLRSRVASSLQRRWPRGRGRLDGNEEATPLVGHLERGDQDAETTAPAEEHLERGDWDTEVADSGEADSGDSGNSAPEARGARRVHLALLPERYEPLDEPAPAEKPKRRYRKRLKKYGKNVGKVVTKGCRYVVIGLQGFAAAYSSPFGVATSVVSFVR